MMRSLFILFIVLGVYVALSAQAAPINFLHSPACRKICILGVQPGLNTEAELLFILESNEIEYFVQEANSETQYLLDVDESYEFLTGPVIVNINDEAIVERIDVPITIDTETIEATYGEPSTILEYNDGTSRMSYSERGLTFILNRAGTNSTEAVVVQPLREQLDLVVTAYAGLDMALDDSNGYPVLGILDGSRSTGKNLAYTWWQDGEIISHDQTTHLPLTYGNYTFTLTVSDEKGSIDVDPVTINIVEAGNHPENGLLGEYYDEFDLTELRFRRIDEIMDFDFGRGSPREDIGRLNFSILWRGQIAIQETGTYIFSADVNNGVTMWIDNKLILNNWSHEESETSSIELKGDQLYDIRIEYYKADVVGNFTLYWQTPANPNVPQIVPTEVLFYDTLSNEERPPIANAGPDRVISIGKDKVTKITLNGTGSVGRGADIISYTWLFEGDEVAYDPTPTVKAAVGTNEYVLIITDANGLVSQDSVTIEVNNLEPDSGLLGEYYPLPDFRGQPFTRVDPNIDFRWGSIAPLPGLAVSDYSIRWSGYLEIPESGDYTLITNSDDGVRLYLDGETLIDNWTFHAPQRDIAEIFLEANRRYQLTLEYFQGQGGAVIELSWIKPGGNEPEIIPQLFFYQSADSPSNLDGGR